MRKHEAKRKTSKEGATNKLAKYLLEYARILDDSNILGFLIGDSNSEPHRHVPHHIPQEELSLILQTSELFVEAVNTSLGIQPTEQLVAYMSMD